jgi:hypothetical protein
MDDEEGEGVLLDVVVEVRETEGYLGKAELSRCSG